jgi:hypothetical protein
VKRELTNHPSVSVMPGSGGCMALFGLPFLLAGLGIVYAAVNELGEAHAPWWVVGFAGGAFALVGAFVTGSGVRDLIRRKAVDRRFDLTEEPWRADFAWDPHRAKDRAARPFAGFGLATFLLVFLTPFNYWAWLSPEGVCFVQGIVSLFDVIALAVLGHAFYVLLRCLKYGDGELTYGGIPFTLGQKAHVTFRPPRALRGYEVLRCTLRCVKEAYEVRGSGDSRSQQVVSYAVYEEERDIPASDVGQSLELTFELPGGDSEGDFGPSELSSRPATYWELEIGAETPGIDYKALFLLPVYADG